MAIQTPLARRPPGHDARHARHATTRARLARRLVAVVVAVILVLGVAAGLALVFVGMSGSGHPTAGPTQRSTRHHPSGRAATGPTVVTAHTTWQLAAPLEGEAVLPVAGAPAQLELFGGTTTGQQEAQGIFTVDLATGNLAQVGDLSGPLTGAAAAVVGGRDMVFGGSAPTPVAAVQSLAASGGSPSTPAVTTTASTGTLPAPRTGAAAVSVGPVTYVVGGEDGATPQAPVLATTDGHHFAAVATLRDPVAYPAVAALGAELYVFGGISLTGPSAGHPLSVVQVVDPVAHTVTVGGTLPEPLAGAAAVVLGGHLFVIGGDSGGPSAARAGTDPSATVYAFEPAAAPRPRPGHRAPSATTTGTVVVAGHLGVPEAYAGVAMAGESAWIIGGDSDGAPLSNVQTVTPSPTTPVAPVHGRS